MAVFQKLVQNPPKIGASNNPGTMTNLDLPSYTYAILDGTKLEEFLKRFESSNTLEKEIENMDFDDFIDLFF